jgi:hypothetical protein
MTPLQFVPHEMKTSVVKIRSYDDKILRGTIFNPRAGGAASFTGAIDMLLAVGRLLDELKFPNPAVDPKRYAGTPPADSRTDEARPPGGAFTPIATFKLKVMFRQNASMQGMLVWTERDLEAKFRSVYELLILLDSVLEQCGGQTTNTQNTI